MKKREIEIFELGFGDIRGDAAERMSADLSPSDAMLVEELKGMKLDLQKLQVPQHQISTERLRDAILREGLQPKAPSTGMWKMIVAPFAAAALAVVGYQTIMKQPNSEPVVLLDSPSSTVAMDSNPVTLNPILDGGFDYSFDHWHESGSSSIARPVQPVRKASSARKPSGSSRSGGIALASSPGLQETVVSPAMKSSAPTAVSMDSMPDAAIPGASNSSGIILIGSETDSTTGANRAIEVQDSRDVLIGG